MKPSYYGDRMSTYLEKRVFLTKEDYVDSLKDEALMEKAREEIPQTVMFPAPESLGGMCEKYDWVNGLPHLPYKRHD